MTQLAVLRHRDAATLKRWLDALDPDDVELAGDVAVAVFGGRLHRDREGRAAGVLCGVLFNDLEIADDLVARGLLGQGASHGELATVSIGQFGPKGLAGLRFQGVVAVLHRAQRGALAATGSFGVGPLYLQPFDGGEMLATDARCFARIDSSLVARPADSDPPVRQWVGAKTGEAQTLRMVSGTAAMIGARGVVCERVRWAPEVQPFFRQRPDVLAGADPATAAALLADAIEDAALATERGRGPLWLGPAHNRCQGWLRRLVQQRRADHCEADAACHWSFLGGRTLTERMRWPQGLAGTTDAEKTATLEAAWMKAFVKPAVRPPLPEPTSRLSEHRAAQRWLRHTVFAHALSARAWQRAADNSWSVAWPHLDPRVLAIAGALPEDVLQSAIDRLPFSELPSA